MNILIALHNLMRWIVIIMAVVALYRAYAGWFGKKDFSELDRKVGVFFGMSMDIQMLLGIILWIFGLWGWKVFGTANSAYFAIEHAPVMVLAVVLSHIGSITARRAKDSQDKHKSAALWFSASVLLVLIAIPWMQRPLLPHL